LGPVLIAEFISAYITGLPFALNALFILRHMLFAQIWAGCISLKKHVLLNNIDIIEQDFEACSFIAIRSAA
jgi:hypothetical protein